MKQDSEYWEKRIANETWKTYNNTEEKNIALMKMYDKTNQSIKVELYALEEKAKELNGLTNSQQYRLKKLLGQQGHIYKEIEKLGVKVENHVKNQLVEGGQSVYENIRKSLGETDFSNLNKIEMEQMLNSPWHGSFFSERLWKDTVKLEKNLNGIINEGMATGRTVTEMAVSLSNIMNKAFNDAHRLVRTESINYLNRSAVRGYKDAGVLKVQWWAAEDERTCDICGTNHGKEYDIDKAPILPCHPGCRCTWLPVVDNNSMSANENVAKESQYDKMKTDKKVNDFEKHVTKIKETLPEEDYNELLELLVNNENKNVQDLYVKYADEIYKIKKVKNGGGYNPFTKTISYDLLDDTQIKKGRNKYSVLAHEYGHFFDDVIDLKEAEYKEIESINNLIGRWSPLKNSASLSDEFLVSARKDKELIKQMWSNDFRDTLLTTNGSAGVQDAIDGMFGSSARMHYGHSNEYYNRKYNLIKKLKKEKEIQKVYKVLGYDASNQAKVKSLLRTYDTSAELWANIASAVTVGGDELVCIKKYLPNSYSKFIKVIGGD